MIRCPYCLNIVDPSLSSGEKGIKTYICPTENCKAAIYRDYVEKKEIPKATVGLVGFTGHGKTVFLSALFYLLKYLKRSQTWGRDAFNWISLDENTHRIMFKHVPLLEEKGELPAGTPENFPHPALIQFDQIPYFGDYFLSFYDTAGSVYESPEKITDMGRFVAHSEVVLFIISMKDCGEMWADRMEALLELYILAVHNQLHIDLKKRQHLIVVLSKADELDYLPDELKSFLQQGHYGWYDTKSAENKKEIIKSKLWQLKEKSRIIEDWLVRNNCAGFTGLAKKRFRSVEYTIVSSLGAAPVGNRLRTKLQPKDPKRVLDPFLLALEKTRRRGIWEKIKEGF